MKEFNLAGCKAKAEAISKAIDGIKQITIEPIKVICKFALIALGNMKGYEEYHTDSAFDETIKDLTRCIYVLEALLEDEEHPLVKAIKDAEQWIWDEYDR